MTIYETSALARQGKLSRREIRWLLTHAAGIILTYLPVGDLVPALRYGPLREADRLRRLPGGLSYSESFLSNDLRKLLFLTAFVALRSLQPLAQKA